HDVFFSIQREGLRRDVDEANASILVGHMRATGRDIFGRRARDILLELTRSGSTDGSTYEILAQIQLESGNLVEAYEYFDKAYRLWPRRRYLYYLSEISYRLGRSADA